MLSLFLRNLFFTLLQPGLVAGLFPYLILGNHRFHTRFSSITATQVIGILIFIIGFCVMIHCIALFAIKGRGTLSPVDPTKKLVIAGLYNYSRNPMYIGVMFMLLAESIFFENLYLLIYSAIAFLAFNLFIHFVEEPRLKRDFGEEYVTYCRQVRKWL